MPAQNILDEQHMNAAYHVARRNVAAGHGRRLALGAGTLVGRLAGMVKLRVSATGMRRQAVHAGSLSFASASYASAGYQLQPPPPTHARGAALALRRDLASSDGSMMSMALRKGRGVAHRPAAPASQPSGDETRHPPLHDTLTQLPNRALLQDRLAHALRVAQRAQTPLALVLLDVDRFAEINDTLGRHGGDLVLQQVGARIQNVLRASDTVARLADDHFAVLLPTDDMAGAVHAVRKILRALTDPILVAEQRLDVTVSSGIVLYPDHGADAEALLCRAYVALHQAKTGSQVYAVYKDA